MRRLDQTTFVSGRQLTVGDMDEAAAQGIRLIVNNRPDGEEPGQPARAEIEAAARAAGLDYRHIPIAGGFPPERIEADGGRRWRQRAGARLLPVRDALDLSLGAGPGAGGGAGGGERRSAAAAAGYDLSPIRRVPALS